MVWLLYQSGQKWAAYLLTFGIVVSQLYQLQANVQKQSPMQLYNFHQAAILLSQKKEIVSEMYRLADAKPFTIGVIGTPYGVQTVWATVFENYLAERPTLEKPNWYGYQALGYPADSYFTKVDHPAERHILVIEQNYELFLSPYIYEQYMDSVNEATVLIEETELYGFKLQLREAKKQLVP
ncbi:MAG: hypothetical protein UZ22_OP11002000796 [Microgenomates bacterium OLB23]|nr:MAG: hypothetical protein UZ22_OP11002000796 [Microgenomates bacterium OLB23]